ncbi:ferredoxin [Clostridium chauvoei]|uniref:Ferredoxin n=2 Tax=Clostridium chauvoei TaxID=46867 RepID=S6F154_9CLOT|nr:ferredoxin [Clostridium chauvoei]ATD55606.1 ferredoxin [Clostridium chauvoei]ATD56717.1 ferredoxin [Clostridium chauvoei]MBX7280977.1 ferredoxin [Clostridium chauvoei]MBX7283414.1 ferredoxin [Clostridium chauvoei]MBX7286009.1 ferredoxin [Clostridium chauvoei]
MKAFVDGDICISCGLCEGTCSEVFSLDTGVAVASEVSEGAEDLVREACDGCPVQAISIEE